jgi:acyl-CoA reductase-like NAD-dependent aldehyde dehydrogenase
MRYLTIPTFGLAGYAYTGSAKTAQAVAAAVETGMMSINYHGLALPEVPFGGVKGFGRRLRSRFGSDRGSPEHQICQPSRPIL